MVEWVGPPQISITFHGRVIVRSSSSSSLRVNAPSRYSSRYFIDRPCAPPSLHESCQPASNAPSPSDVILRSPAEFAGRRRISNTAHARRRPPLGTRASGTLRSAFRASLRVTYQSLSARRWRLPHRLLFDEAPPIRSPCRLPFTKCLAEEPALRAATKRSPIPRSATDPSPFSPHRVPQLGSGDCGPVRRLPLRGLDLPQHPKPLSGPL